MRRARRGRKTPRWRRPSRAALGWASALAGAAALQVWVQLQTTELGYEIGLVRQLMRRAASERGELEAELAAVTSPRALDRAAARLGLRPPAEGQVVGLAGGER